MLSRKSQILMIDKVKESIDFAVNSNNLVCIGVDGPTASGKTIFAELMKKEITNISDKDVQIVPLDSLLVERTFREKSLQNIEKVGLPFEHEAEIHMRFSKFDDLLNLVHLKKENLTNESKIILKNLYSRSDEGRCSGKLSINLTNKTVLIFEGHYTTRPEFGYVLDRNFILLATREELIKRKIERVANYRNKKEVEDYFDMIDEPSYLSNFYRFASKNSLIIDNTNLINPFLANYAHIKKLLNTKKFLQNKKISIHKIKEFIFGLHGLSKYDLNQENDIDKLFQELESINLLDGRQGVSKLFDNNKIRHEIIYFDFITKERFEIGLITRVFDINCVWIVSKNLKEVSHLIAWEGGIFQIKNKSIEKLSYLSDKSLFNNNNNFLTNTVDCKDFIRLILFEHNSKSFVTKHCFFDDSNRISFLATVFKYSQFTYKSLGDFFSVSLKGSLEEKIENITTKPSAFILNKFNFTEKDYKYFIEETESYILTQDFLLLKTYLSEDIIKQLEDIYFKSSDIKIRSTIISGLLSEENKQYIEEKVIKYLKYSIGFFPVSMSRLYVLRRMGIEHTNVLATNVYDITDNPIDSSAYLEAAFEKQLPTILQISLNASGQSELKPNGSKNIGYLKPENGINDFTDTITDEIVRILENSDFEKDRPPLVGLGLDHVDLKGDFPVGRSKRFLEKAVSTECITHITLDGSEKFKPKNKLLSELFLAYKEVFKTSLGFLDKTNINCIDLEFCTGELNYIENENKPHYPDGKEMSLLPICFYYSLSNEKDKKYKVNLLNSLKLYVGNLGTTHHGNDEENSLNIALAEQWQKSLEGTNFISPVLHGTTGSSDNTFSLASKSCYKINIAGSFLRVFLENLNSSQKEFLGFNSFDEKSKLLCSKLRDIRKDQISFVKKELKKEFFRYCRINNVQLISKENEKFVRKPYYGRNKIAKHIFLKLKQIITS